MSAAPKNTPKDLQQLIDQHERTTAGFRAGLMQRSAGEVLYDDCLLEEMRKGKPFEAAMQTANAAFPTEALDPDDEALADTEAHYRFFLNMAKTDELCRELEECQARIEDADRKVAEALLEATAPDEGKAGPGGL